MTRLRPATEGLGRGKQGSNKAKSKKEKVKRKNKKNLETRDKIQGNKKE